MRPETRRLTIAGLAFWAGVALALGAAGAASDAPGAPPPDGEIVSPSPIGEVRFPHAMHAEELGLECAECHHETDAAELRMPHQEYLEDFWIDCGSCHRKGDAPAEPRGCGECHHASPASNADETLSAKVVIHRSCWGCHESGRGEEAGRSCGFCHAGAPEPAEEAR